jgi:hypothetical protein
MKPSSLPSLRRAVDVCLWLYPRAWRLRYHQEMWDLLEQYPVTVWTVVDVLLGAGDAHFHQQWLPQEVLSMAQQIRTSANTLLVAFSLFLIAWVMVPFIRDTPDTWNAATAHHPEIIASLLLFVGAGAVAVIAVLIGGIPLLVASVAQAVWGRRPDVWARLLIPVLLGMVLVAFSLVAQPAWWARFGVRLPTSALWLKVGFFLLAFLVLGGSTWALASALTRSNFSDSLLRFLRLPGFLLGVALWSAFLAVLALTILVMQEEPQLAEPGFLLPGFAAVVLCACGLASAALKRMFSAPPPTTVVGSDA